MYLLLLGFLRKFRCQLLKDPHAACPEILIYIAGHCLQNNVMCVTMIPYKEAEIPDTNISQVTLPFDFVQETWIINTKIRHSYTACKYLKYIFRTDWNYNNSTHKFICRTNKQILLRSKNPSSVWKKTMCPWKYFVKACGNSPVCITNGRSICPSAL